MVGVFLLLSLPVPALIVAGWILGARWNARFIARASTYIWGVTTTAIGAASGIVSLKIMFATREDPDRFDPVPVWNAYILTGSMLIAFVTVLILWFIGPGLMRLKERES